MVQVVITAQFDLPATQVALSPVVSAWPPANHAYCTSPLHVQSNTPNPQGAVEYDSLLFSSPMNIAGAVEDVTFNLPAPGVLENVTAPPGFTVSVINNTQPRDGCGSATVASNGAMTLVPSANFFGGCNFTFGFLDGDGQYMEATAIVTFGEWLLLLLATGFQCPWIALVVR